MFIFIGSETGGIRAYRADDALAPWQMLHHFPAEVGPTRFVIGPNKRMLYCLHGGDTRISAFAIDRRSGSLRLVSRIDTGGLYPAGACLTDDGRTLLVTHAGSGHVSLLPLAADGALGACKHVITLPGHAHDAVMAPGGHYAVVTDRHVNSLCVLRRDAMREGLVINQVFRARPGAAPHRAMFHPSLPILYVSNAGNMTVSAYHWHAASGRLSFAQSIRAMASDWTDANEPAGILISADGRYLYVANRGHGGITIFAIQPGKGKLFVRAREATGGQSPVDLMWTPRGAALLVASHDGNRIVRFAVTTVNGMLSRADADIAIARPAAIALIE